MCGPENSWRDEFDAALKGIENDDVVEEPTKVIADA